MIEFLGHKINSKAAEKPQLSNDYQFFDTPSVTNIWGGHHFISDSMSSTLTQISSASAVSRTMVRAVPEMGVEDTSRTSQNLSTMNETCKRTFQLSVVQIQREETQICQSTVHEQRNKNNLMDNSNLQMISTPSIDRSSEFIRGVPSSDLNALLMNSSCTFAHDCSKSHNVTCTPDSRLAMSTELPPVLHLEKHPAAVPFPDGLSCMITPYPKPLGISESTDLSPLVNRSSTIDQNFMQKTEKSSAHEAIEVIVEGTKFTMADELEHKNSKNEDYRFTLTLSASLYGSNAQVSEKAKSKKLEDWCVVEKTVNNTDYTDPQSQSNPERAYPMQHEIRKRNTPRNFWVNWLRRPKERFPLVRYRLVNTKVLVVSLSYGLILSNSRNIAGL